MEVRDQLQAPADLLRGTNTRYQFDRKLDALLSFLEVIPNKITPHIQPLVNCEIWGSHSGNKGPEDGDIMFLRNVDIYLRVNTVS
jgi:hypothetical protein